MTLTRKRITLVCVEPGLTTRFWPMVRDMIDRSYAASDCETPPDLLAELMAGRKLLWIAIDTKDTIVAAMITAMWSMRGGGRMLKMHECGGERLEEWKHLRAEIEQYAKAEGCDRVMIEGRPGWSRLMPDYKLTAVILEKRI